MRTFLMARCWLLALVAATALATGCGREEATGGAGGGAGAAPGVSEDEIKLGGSYPFSGPASAYASIAQGAKARFAAENAEGGIDGRRINFITLDDGYEPAKALNNARRLITQDRVFALFNTLGTPNNLAIWDYVNQQEVPHLWIATGASYWGEDIEAHPWTTGWQPSYVDEARIYAEFLRNEKPDAKVAVLFQNDAYGKDLLAGFEEAIAGSGIEIVARESYEVTDPTITSQIRKLANSGGDTFLDITTPKFSAQAITGVARSGWRPLHILNNVGASKSQVLEPAGLDEAEGIWSSTYYKDPEDPTWANDAAMKEYKEAVRRHQPDANPDESLVVYGWTAATTMIETLRRADGLTRDAVMDAARHLDIEQPMLLPGVRVTMDGARDAYPIQAMQMMRFDGENWKLKGEVIDAGRLDRAQPE